MKKKLIITDIITINKGEKFYHATVNAHEIWTTISFFGKLKEQKRKFQTIRVYTASKVLEDSRWYYSETDDPAPEITDFIYNHFKNIEVKKKAKMVYEDWVKSIAL